MATHQPTHRAIRYLLLVFALGLDLFLPAQSIVTYSAVPQAVVPQAATGEWEPTLNWGIFGKHMALLPNNKLLAWPTGQDAFLWDLTTNTKVAVPATFGDLHCAAQVTLADGRVLVAGGVIVNPHDGTQVTAIFDWNTNQWTEKTPMHYPRWYGTATTLGDGRVLLTSGDMPGDLRADIPEIYDPVADTWAEMPASASKDLGLYPLMFVLPSGKAYAAGSKANTYQLDIDSASPSYGTWLNGPTNAFGSSGYAESAAMYAPGKIIRSGGKDPAIANAASIDMTAASPQWTQLSPMNYPRRRHNMVILADGEVMAVGGTTLADDPTAAVLNGEIWDPATGQWALTAPMTNNRMYHSAALLLPDGRVLAAGGEDLNSRYNAQIFKPPYLFKGPRPVINTAPTIASYGSNMTINVTTDGSAIDSVALIRPAAVTHAFDHNQRYVPLQFTQNGNTVTATAPANGNLAPPGYYMLVVKDSKGVPSVASWVRIDSAANMSPGTISGTVTDGSTSNPIAGATVSYSGGSTTTNGSGNYTLANVPAGEQVITVSKIGYATISKPQTVVGSGTATLNFALSPPGSITGTITALDTGDPIANATIQYSGGSVTADSAGHYTITGVSAGSESLIVSAFGYTSSAPRVVTVIANSTVTANFALATKPTYIAGEVRDSYTNETVAGAAVSNGTAISTTDSLGRYQLFAPPGVYTMTVSMNGYATLTKPNVAVTFGSYTAEDFTLDPLNPTFAFTPIADSYVVGENPTANFGSSSTIRLDSGTANMNTYLRFNISGMARPAQDAKLRLYVTNPSDLAGQVYSVSNDYQNTTTPWVETGATGITWNNAPTIAGTPLSSAGIAAQDTWVEFDVTSAITGNGIVNFGLKAASTDEVRFSSREGSNPPQLIVQQQLPPPLPTITNLLPGSGSIGAEIMIEGTHFADVAGVKFNSTPATSFTVASPTMIHAVVPAGATSGKVTVTTAAGTATSAANFTVLSPPVPTISSFTPASGPVGTSVLIKGTNFVNVTAVKLNGLATDMLNNVTVESDTSLRVIIPASATSGKLSVVTEGGVATSASSFTVTKPAPAPTISSFTPASGPIGTEVVIKGANFVNLIAVKFNSTSASSFTVDSASQIHAVVPPGASSGKISITTKSGTATSATTFQVTPKPQLKYQVFLPSLQASPSTTSTSARAQYSALSTDWHISMPFGYCPLQPS
jgi:Domain of unknown function (DUF1929)/Carboxypeptidase regulatory-like domain/IPT/TIG domain